MQVKITLWRALVCGLVLSAMPLAAIARHLHMENSDIRLILPATLNHIPGAGHYLVQTTIHSLELSELSGADQFKTGETIFVHMARGPQKIAYPFAVTHQRPHDHGVESAFSIRGHVISQEGSQLDIRYSFENLVPNGTLKSRLSGYDPVSGHVELNINEMATARIMNLEFDGQSYTHRMIENPVETGLTQ